MSIITDEQIAFNRLQFPTSLRAIENCFDDGYYFDLRDHEVMRVMFRMAYKYAMLNSDDPKTKNAAILVIDSKKRELVFGTNRLPSLPKDTPPHILEDLIQSVKDRWIIHAEEAVISNASSNLLDVVDSTMFACWAPCTRCARSIIDRGIGHLVVHKHMHDRTYEKYKADIGEAVRMLELAGIEYEQFDDVIGDCQNVMNNETWNP